MNLSKKIAAGFSPVLLEIFQEIGHHADKRHDRAVFVGGVVRDLLLGNSTVDADVMLEHPARAFVEHLAKKFEAKLVSHERFYTFTLHFPGGEKIDVVTAREETYAAPAHLPEVVPSTIEKDLKRRDFTINAIACWLNKSKFGETMDPFDGKGDLKRKFIRVLHAKSFEDDPTRIYRAARFAGRLGFQIEPESMKWIDRAISERRPTNLSPVRRRHEFELILKEKNPLLGLRLLQVWGALELLCAGWGDADLAALDFKSSMDFDDRLACWFQGWGKDQAQQMLTELSFEKTIKHKVLSKLVQSPSKS